MWLAWIFDWPSSWGLPNGPELTLWAAVLGGMLITRTLAITRRQKVSDAKPRKTGGMT